MMSASRRRFLKGMSAFALLPVMPALAMDHALPDKYDQSIKDGSHRILCCNIRVALDEDEAKGVGWSARRDICLKIIKDKKPDIISLQEVLKVQADDFRKYFSNYQLFGFDGPEMDAHTTGYHGIAKNPILFSRDRYELMTGGTYWLSQTPLVAGSKSWETNRARHANWVRLREKKTGKELRIVNLHLDHISAEAKVEQAKMVVEESKQYQPGFNQLLTGDFNTRFDSNVFTAVRGAGWKESYETIHGEKEAGHTGHEFQGEKYEKGPSKGRIDYIWYQGKVKPTSSLIIKDQVNGKYPSDHFFMQTDFVLE
ncbi:MAG: endonuclease/exonuclease/phosphatase family protein [Chitinophagaceae bacterium]|nr:MAG: endonuclease/exonuclease/phosphatase family protein [Chitinophagaceae bacterium]